MENYIGRMLGGRYEVREVIGTGGMAIVYKAYCTILHRYVAIKVLKDEFASDEEFRKRFYNEAQAVAKLSHNNIVSIYDVCHDAGGAEYIVMELCEGVTLKDYLRKKHHLTWQETLFFAQQVARALDHAHSRGIIHQDIKPQNIMLLRDGTAKVMDFGIASFANSQETRKVSSEAIGSVHYISPEQAKGQPVDFRTDLYSLGIVMYEMLTGTLPFRGENAVAVVMQHLNSVPPLPSTIEPAIPAAMDEIVMHAMCANAAQRYGSALDMYRDMERLRTNPNLVLNYSNRSDLDDTRAVKYTQEDMEEQRTQYIPRTPQQPPVNRQQRVYQPVSDPDDEYEQEEPRKYSGGQVKKSGVGAKVAVGAVIVVLLCVIGYMVSGMLGNKDSGDTVDTVEQIAVPNFISLNYDADVKGNSEYSNFVLKIETHDDSSGTYEDGQIIDQDPKQGTQVDAGSTVTLTVVAVSEEDEKTTTVDVPSVENYTYEDAQSALRSRGLSATRSEESSESVEKDHVIRTDPAAGSQVAVGSSVTVIVSSGPANTNKKVPNLSGMTQSAAQALLENYGLKLGEVKQEESESPAGTVIAQTVPADTEVAEGTAVGITIAIENADKKPDETPDGDGSASVAVSNTSVTVTLPTDRDNCNVTVAVGGSTLYNQNVKTSRGTAVCRVAYSGTQRIVVTIDGETVYDQDYTFS